MASEFLELDPIRIRRALSLFSSPGIFGASHSLSIGFERLGLEIDTRAKVMKQSGLRAATLRDSGQLARLFAYVSFRLGELLMRLRFMNWLQERCRVDGADYSFSWHNFAALAIKDFHVDLGSVVDAVAPVVLQAFANIDVAAEKKWPGFPDILKKGGSDRAAGYRELIDSNVLKTIDSTDRWWPAAKRVRDDLTHREHDKIVFGEPAQGIFFQLYTSDHAPKIIDARLMWSQNPHVVDFRLYSAAIVGELLSFLEELGEAIEAQLKLSTRHSPPSVHDDDFSYLVDPMKQLLLSLQTSAE